jgi:hypothetical protein
MKKAIETSITPQKSIPLQLSNSRTIYHFWGPRRKLNIPESTRSVDLLIILPPLDFTKEEK